MDLRALAGKSFPHERLFAGYFVFVALLLALAGSPIPDRWLRLAWHLAFAVVLIFLFPLFGERGWKGTLRHWLPIVILAVVYTELDVLNVMFTDEFHDAQIVALEDAVFGSQLAVELRRWFPYRPISEYLHFSYFSYYFLFPILGISLFLRGKLNEFRYASTTVLATFVVCYTIFIFYPVGGPWNYFERPSLDEVGHLAPILVHTVLIAGESVGTAFPSSHVAAALTIWLAAAHVDRRIFLVQAFLVPALIVGTMYGGFHYAVDVVAGIAIGLIMTALAPRIYRALGGHGPERVG